MIVLSRHRTSIGLQQFIGSKRTIRSLCYPAWTASCVCSVSNIGQQFSKAPLLEFRIWDFRSCCSSFPVLSSCDGSTNQLHNMSEWPLWACSVHCPTQASKHKVHTWIHSVHPVCSWFWVWTIFEHLWEQSWWRWRIRIQQSSLHYVWHSSSEWSGGSAQFGSALVVGWRAHVPWTMGCRWVFNEAVWSLTQSIQWWLWFLWMTIVSLNPFNLLRKCIHYQHITNSFGSYFKYMY